MKIRRQILALLCACLLAGGTAAHAVNVLDRVENPDAVEDWEPVLREQIAVLPQGAVLHLPGPRTYILGAPLKVERSLTLRLDPAAELVAGQGVPVLISVYAPEHLSVEATSGRALLRNGNPGGVVFDFKTIPAEAAPDITLRRLHVVGAVGVDGRPEAGVRYVADQGSVGDWVIQDCHFENSEGGILHRRGTLSSLRLEDSVFSGEPRMGVLITSPITNGAYVRGNRFLKIGVRALQLGGGAASMIDAGAVNHLSGIVVHENLVLGGGHLATERDSYIMGLLVYGNNISIQGNVVRDFNRGEPVPGARVGQHLRLSDGTWHRGPWIGTPRRRLAGAAIYAKARNGIIANNVCTNSGWRSVIEIKTGGREHFFLVANNIVDGSSLAIDESFGFEPNVSKSLWTGNLVYNMPNEAFKVSNRMMATYTNNLIQDSRIGFRLLGDRPAEFPSLIANNNFINVEEPVTGLKGMPGETQVAVPLVLSALPANAAAGIAQVQAGVLAVTAANGSGDPLRIAGTNAGLQATWAPGITVTAVAGAAAGASASENASATVLPADAVALSPAAGKVVLELGDGSQLQSEFSGSVSVVGSTGELKLQDVWAQETGAGIGGAPALRIGGGSLPDFNWLLRKQLPLEQGKTYRAEALVQLSDRSGRVSLFLDDSGENRATATSADTPGWQRLSVEFTVPTSDGVRPRVRLYGRSGAEGKEVRVGALRIEEVSKTK